jgi:hypothetical protein
MLLKLKDILPNPDRDYIMKPLNEEKIAELVASIKETGYWENVVVRINKEGRPEAAHGHHRIEAAIRAGLTEANFIIRDWSDEQMLRSMADENSKEYDYNILALLESVKGVVMGLTSGKIAPFEINEKTKKECIRYAPSFTRNESSTSGVDHPYTAASIAKYLKTSRANTGEGETTERADIAVTAALNALEILQSQEQWMPNGTPIKYDYSFLYRLNEDGEKETLSAKGLFKATQQILKLKRERTQEAVQTQASIQKNTERLAKLDAERREVEQKETERQAELRRKEIAANAEKDLEEAKRWAEEQRVAAERKAERVLEYNTKRAALDEKVQAATERAEEAQKKNKGLPTKHKATTCINKLSMLVSERNAFRAELASLSRDKELTQGDRERVRQGLLAVSEWYAEQSIQFRPVVHVDVLKEAQKKEEAKHKREEKQ